MARLEPAGAHRAPIPCAHRRDVKADTRKIDTYEAFASSLGDDARQAAQPAAGGSPFGPGGGSSSLKSFVDKRHEYLAKYTPTNKDPITSMTQRKTRP